MNVDLNVKCLLFCLILNRREFSQQIFVTSTQYKISQKSIQWEPRYTM